MDTAQPKASLVGLQSRVRTATKADREIDRTIALDFKWPIPRRAGDDGEMAQRMVDVPKFSESIDAALALVERVLPGANCYGFDKTNKGFDGYVSRNYCEKGLRWMQESLDRPTAPLAILDALLSALIAQSSAESAVLPKSLSSPI